MKKRKKEKEASGTDKDKNTNMDMDMETDTDADTDSAMKLANFCLASIWCFIPCSVVAERFHLMAQVPTAL
jgi:hypothetical protein